MHPMTERPIDFVTAAPTAGSLDVTWIHGAPSRRRARDPKIQVHFYEEHTVILRQSKSVHYEPFSHGTRARSAALARSTDPRLRTSANLGRSASVWPGPSASAGPPIRYSTPTPDGLADGGEFRVGDAMIWKLLTTFRAGLIRASVSTPDWGS